MSNLRDLDRPFAQIKQEKGRLDIVLANAGVAKVAALGRVTEELYGWTFDINVKGLLFTVQKALPLLPDGASIILNSCVSHYHSLSLHPGKDTPAQRHLLDLQNCSDPPQPADSAAVG